MGKDRDQIIGSFVAEVETAAGGPLRSIVLYGSGASGEYVPGRSDLNFLLVADPITRSLLAGLQKRMVGWHKRGIATPLVVDQQFLVSSTDSYPLEILGMLSAYKILGGVDPFQGLEPAPKDVRLQAEREAKAKALLLRRGYLECCGRHSGLVAYLTGAVPAIEAILRGMLFLRGGDWRLCGAGLRAACARDLAIDCSVLEMLQDVHYGRAKPTRQSLLALFDRTMDLLDLLSRQLDQTAAAG